MNRQLSMSTTKAGKSEVQRLLNAHNLAKARLRIHMGNAHPEGGYKVTKEDLDIVVREGRTKP
jgi:hypothetical protein